jgi:hypothetical protein
MKHSNPSFRSLVIDLLDSPNGIPDPTYQILIVLAGRDYPGKCDDIWPLTESNSTPIGLFVWLNEDDAENLRKKF